MCTVYKAPCCEGCENYSACDEVCERAIAYKYINICNKALAKAIVDNNTLEYECDDEDMELIFDCFDNSSGHIGIMNVYLELGLMPDEAFEAK